MSSRPSGPDYDKRVKAPSQLEEGKHLRRYYWNGKCWVHADYVIASPPRPILDMSLVVGVRVGSFKFEMFLSDMGIPSSTDDRSVNQDVYSIIL